MITNYQNVSSVLDLPLKEVKDVRIRIVNKNEYKEIYEYNKNNSFRETSRGCFIMGGCDPSLEPPFIMMMDELSIVEQLFVFFHEYGHYQCYTEHCRCFYYGKMMAEKHAWKISFELMLYYKCYQSLVVVLILTEIITFYPFALPLESTYSY